MGFQNQTCLSFQMWFQNTKMAIAKLFTLTLQDGTLETKNYIHLLYLKVNGLCFHFELLFSQFHYRWTSSWWVFADKSVASMKTMGDGCHKVTGQSLGLATVSNFHNRSPTGQENTSFHIDWWLPAASKHSLGMCEWGLKPF